jgi:hypothetical protein
VDTAVPCLIISTSGGLDTASWRVIRESKITCLAVAIYDEFCDEQYHSILRELTRIASDTSSLRLLHAAFEARNSSYTRGCDFLKYAMRRFLLAIAANSWLCQVSMQAPGAWAADTTQRACVSSATCEVYLYAGPDSYVSVLRPTQDPLQVLSTCLRSPTCHESTVRIRVDKQCIAKNLAVWADSANVAFDYAPIALASRQAARISFHGRIAEGPWPQQMTSTNELIVVCPSLPHHGADPIFSAENMRRLVAMAPVADTWVFIGEYSMQSMSKAQPTK